jgi:hypothetical protein
VRRGVQSSVHGRRVVRLIALAEEEAPLRRRAVEMLVCTMLGVEAVAGAAVTGNAIATTAK